jgi:phage major head subunit gpT-like protein
LARHVHDLKPHGFSILNRSFESTIKVKADDISDDRLGIFKPMFGEMGWQARQHPEQMIFELLGAGFDTKCFDGSTYFSEAHSVIDAKEKKVDVSNMQAGSGPAWFLLDTSRMMRPIVWQVREGYTFTSMASPSNPTVVLNGEHYYGVNARVNAGFGLWQLAYASKAELTPDNYAAAARRDDEFPQRWRAGAGHQSNDPRRIARAPKGRDAPGQHRNLRWGRLKSVEEHGGADRHALPHGMTV